MSTDKNIVFRTVQKSDLDAVNAVIASCVMAWNLPERVKRLSLSSYRYDSHDLGHLEMLLAERVEIEIVGVAAWEPAIVHDLPSGKSGFLLHGLYVAPQHQQCGIGSCLINSTLDAVRSHGKDGLLVKAQTDAVGFFQSRGFILLPIEIPERDYPYRWWRPVRSGLNVEN